ncbi:hypothetical protein WN982_31090 [Paraburkholderia sp. IMGN_8]|uniref:hypothetical protein n=1 Tax=Paraburkholderia sp. IMGN_8 TaxID=3136564 RepID=UPI003101471B
MNQNAKTCRVYSTSRTNTQSDWFEIEVEDHAQRESAGRDWEIVAAAKEVRRHVIQFRARANGLPHRALKLKRDSNQCISIGSLPRTNAVRVITEFFLIHC